MTEIIMENADKILPLLYLLFSNLGTFMAIVIIYTKLIHKQAKVEFLLKRVCDKLQISTDTGL